MFYNLNNLFARTKLGVYNNNNISNIINEDLVKNSEHNLCIYYLWVENTLYYSIRTVQLLQAFTWKRRKLILRTWLQSRSLTPMHT